MKSASDRVYSSKALPPRPLKRHLLGRLIFIAAVIVVAIIVKPIIIEQTWLTSHCRRLGAIPRIGKHLQNTCESLFSSSPASPQGLSLSAAGYCIRKDESTSGHICGEDAYESSLSRRHRVFLAVADGVGGWTTSGGDSSKISTGLLSNMKHFIEQSELPLSVLLQSAYDKMIKDGGYSHGSTTVCAALLDLHSAHLNMSNIGDSAGYLIRKGKVVGKTKLGVEGFNAPHQIGFDDKGRPYGSVSRQETTYSFKLESDDVIVLASDGILDNMFDKDIVKFVKTNIDPIIALGSKDLNELLSGIAEKMAKEAYSLSKDSKRMSPFAKAAQSKGYYFEGGYLLYEFYISNKIYRKQDDITVMLAIVK